MIRVAVAGAAGRMGETVCAAVEQADDMELCGRADPLRESSVADVLEQAQVLVDFTQPEVALENALAGLRAGVHVVVGTSGFDAEPLRDDACAQQAPRANALVVPNLAPGGVLMIR